MSHHLHRQKAILSEYKFTRQVTLRHRFLPYLHKLFFLRTVRKQYCQNTSLHIKSRSVIDSLLIFTMLCFFANRASKKVPPIALNSRPSAIRLSMPSSVSLLETSGYLDRDASSRDALQQVNCLLSTTGRIRRRSVPISNTTSPIYLRLCGAWSFYRSHL